MGKIFISDVAGAIDFVTKEKDEKAILSHSNIVGPCHLARILGSSKTIK